LSNTTRGTNTSHYNSPCAMQLCESMIQHETTNIHPNNIEEMESGSESILSSVTASPFTPALRGPFPAPILPQNLSPFLSFDKKTENKNNQDLDREAKSSPPSVTKETILYALFYESVFDLYQLLTIEDLDAFFSLISFLSKQTTVETKEDISFHQFEELIFLFLQQYPSFSQELLLYMRASHEVIIDDESSLYHHQTQRIFPNTSSSSPTFSKTSYEQKTHLSQAFLRFAWNLLHSIVCTLPPTLLPTSSIAAISMEPTTTTTSLLHQQYLQVSFFRETLMKGMNHLEGLLQYVGLAL
jgi:hypothetical protein